MGYYLLRSVTANFEAIKRLLIYRHDPHPQLVVLDMILLVFRQGKCGTKHLLVPSEILPVVTQISAMLVD